LRLRLRFRTPAPDLRRHRNEDLEASAVLPFRLLQTSISNEVAGLAFEDGYHTIAISLECGDVSLQQFCRTLTRDWLTEILLDVRIAVELESGRGVLPREGPKLQVSRRCRPCTAHPTLPRSAQHRVRLRRSMADPSG